MKRILIVGYGVVGRRFHGMISQLVKAKTICDLVVEWQDLTTQSSPRPYTDYDGFLITTPSARHIMDLKTFIPFRKPILVEKPAVMSQPEFLEAVHAMMTNDHTDVFVGYQMRFLDQIQDLRHMLQRGEFGELIEVNVKFGYDIEKWSTGRQGTPYPYRDGIILEASHELDLIQYLFPKAEFVNAALIRRPGRRHLPAEQAQLMFGLPTLCSVVLNYLQPRYERWIEVIGSDRTAKYSFFQEGMLSAYGAELREFLRLVTHGERPSILARLYQCGKLYDVIGRVQSKPDRYVTTTDE